MKKTIFLVFVILLCSIALSTNVTRTMSLQIDEGADLYITLTVTLDAEDTMIAIEETIPSEFIIKDNNGGDSQQLNTLQWIETEASGIIIYEYKLDVGNNPGIYNFSGKYVTETADTVVQTITGNTAITVNVLIPTCTGDDWTSTDGACQSTNTLTRTWSQINTICQDGTTHDPLIETITCDYTAPTCTSFKYEDWSTCSQQGTQTTTILTKTPTGCNDTSSITSQSCTYIPTCLEENWTPTYGDCQDNNTQIVNWNKTLNCENGYQPTSPQTQTCNYDAPTCTSFTYSDFGSCQQVSGSIGIKFRTESTRTPQNCEGRTQILTQDCDFEVTCTDSYWNYSLGACINDIQIKTWEKIAECIGGTPRPNTENIACLSTKKTPKYCGTDDWDSRIEPTTCPSTGIQTKYWTKNKDCHGGLTKSPQETISCSLDIECTSFTYSEWTDCSTSGSQTRVILTNSPTGCINGDPELTQNCTPQDDHCDGTICGETCYIESGICCNDNWNKNKGSCDMDISNIIIEVEDSNSTEAINLVNQAQNSIENGELAKGLAQAQLALLNSKLEDNPELIENYENALVALTNGDYQTSEQLSIIALAKIAPHEQLFNLGNPLTQIIVILVILAIIIMFVLLFGRKKELKEEYASEKNTGLRQETLFEKEDLLAELKKEFKKD